MRLYKLICNNCGKPIGYMPFISDSSDSDDDTDNGLRCISICGDTYSILCLDCKENKE